MSIGMSAQCHLTMWLFSVVLVAPLAMAQEDPEYVSHVVVVQFAPGTVIANKTSVSGLQEFDRRAAQYDVHLIERVYPFLDHVQPTPKTRRNLLALRRTYYVRYRVDADPRRAAGDLAAVPGVTYAEPVLVNRVYGPAIQAEPDDTLFNAQTYLRHLRLPEAWDIVKGEDATPPVVIAIVDSGSDWRHEDLFANVWTNVDEIPGNGVDDDNNGFIDDVHGANFANGDNTDNDPTVLPETSSNAFHGTAVAGAASAVSDNATGLAGAAWNAQLMHINAGCRGSSLGDICHGYSGILYAAANGADIINTSWGGLALFRSFPEQTLDLATDMGALVVAAAGNYNSSNDHSLNYPSAYPRVLSVGATDKDSRRRAAFSQYGKTVNVFAPGVDIITTVPGDEYKMSATGTSFASPLVSGVAALVKTRFPDMSPDMLREQLRLASENMDADNPGYAGRLGRGYVNAEASLQTAAFPAVRVRRWSMRNADGNPLIGPGDEVTINATVVNYLADAWQLNVELTAAKSYPYITIAAAEQSVGYLERGDSTEVAWRITIAADAPEESRVGFFFRIRDGAFIDEVDAISFEILNKRIKAAYAALTALYTATDGDNWTNNIGWGWLRTLMEWPTIKEFGTWYGVGVRRGFISDLVLSSNNLKGTLPSELGQLLQLQTLSLQSNMLLGPIPAELGQFSQLLKLELWSNSLTGTIPAELGKLSQLQSLSLWRNSLTGAIPAELGQLSQLQSLSLWSNSLSGAIPSELGQLSKLQWLKLQQNSLSGAIPSELGQLSQLKLLNLASNSLSELIPAELGQLSQLQWLNLSQNYLTGSIPSELGSLSKMQALRLDSNSLTGRIPAELGQLMQLKGLHLGRNKLSEAIPAELGQLSQLLELDLWGNALTGAIPAELGQLSQLQELNLWNNSLSGSIPPELGQLSRLKELHLGGNTLSGQIPAELGQLSELQELNLWNNALTGAIPPELGQLSRLKELHLGGNTLSGQIPEELGRLSQLRKLLLWGQFTGPIPAELSQLSQLQTLSLWGQLTGPIPAELGQLSQLHSLNLSENTLSGPIPPDLGNLTQLKALLLQDNTLEGALPRSLMQLDNLEQFHFGGQNLCAPQDNAFQSWLSGIQNVDGPTCSGLQLAGTVADQKFPIEQPIAPLVLPEAIGGLAPLVYSVTPALPAGLSFDAPTRTISGTPTEVTAGPVPYTYRVTDANGTADSLQFGIEVSSSVAADHETVPVSFAVHGNYPNPFRQSTRIVFDLPWPARVTVELMDVTGRRVLAVSPKDLTAGWEHDIELHGEALPSGFYLYRLMAKSPEVLSTHVGGIVRLR